MTSAPVSSTVVLAAHPGIPRGALASKRASGVSDVPPWRRRRREPRRVRPRPALVIGAAQPVVPTDVTVRLPLSVRAYPVCRSPICPVSVWRRKVPSQKRRPLLRDAGPLGQYRVCKREWGRLSTLSTRVQRIVNVFHSSKEATWIPCSRCGTATAS